MNYPIALTEAQADARTISEVQPDAKCMSELSTGGTLPDIPTPPTE